MVLHLEGKLGLLHMSLIERAGPVTEISTHSIFLCKNFEDEKVDHRTTSVLGPSFPNFLAGDFFTENRIQLS